MKETIELLQERRRHYSHPELQTGACTASNQPGKVDTRLKLNHKHAAQCTDLYVSSETPFMIKNGCPKRFKSHTSESRT